MTTKTTGTANSSTRTADELNEEALDVLGFQVEADLVE